MLCSNLAKKLLQAPQLTVPGELPERMKANKDLGEGGKKGQILCYLSKEMQSMQKRMTGDLFVSNL